MELLGLLTLGVFIAYERFYASHPLMPSRILVNRAFLCTVSVDFLYFVSGLFWFSFRVGPILRRGLRSVISCLDASVRPRPRPPSFRCIASRIVS